ncbi:MAG: N-acyl homoserine lactonase family protein [Candidatus Bathyarchaeia archaeon]
MKLHVLNNGFFTLDKSFLIYGKYQGSLYQAALKPMLIITEKEKILVDTGVGELPSQYQKFYPITQKPEETMEKQLQMHSVSPRDIDIVVNTHLHFDHCGNNALFPHAKFYVQADELRYAYAPDRFQQAAYMRELFDLKNIDYVPIKGKYWLNDNVLLVPTPGHTVGHQSVLVKTEGKNYVYCGDAAPLRENLEKRNIPGMLYQSDKALYSIDKLRNIKKAHYIFSHDNEQTTLP